MKELTPKKPKEAKTRFREILVCFEKASGEDDEVMWVNEKELRECLKTQKVRWHTDAEGKKVDVSSGTPATSSDDIIDPSTI